MFTWNRDKGLVFTVSTLPQAESTFATLSRMFDFKRSDPARLEEIRLGPLALVRRPTNQ